MHHLYNGNEGYSEEVRLAQRYNPAMWALIRGQVLRLLAGVLYDIRAHEALENIPFELWQATNSFDDKFNVLYMQAPTAKFLELARASDQAGTTSKYSLIAEAMKAKGTEVRFISIDLSEDGSADVDTPELKATSATVELALENLNTLLQHSSQGPASAVDRIHTALHAHLLYLCRTAGCGPSENADMGALLTLLRNSGPSVNSQTDSIFRGLAKVIGALNPVRNDHSLAHPSEALLEEPEARLVLNAGRTLLRYLDSKFAK